MDTLAVATREAIKVSGEGILGSPERFVGYVTDFIDTDSPEARVLYRCCDERFLAFFSEALTIRTPEAFDVAVTHAADWLAHEYLIAESAARSTSEQLARGVAEYADVVLRPGAPVQAAGVATVPALAVPPSPTMPSVSVPPTPGRGQAMTAGSNVAAGASMPSAPVAAPGWTQAGVASSPAGASVASSAPVQAGSSGRQGQRWQNEKERQKAFDKLQREADERERLRVQAEANKKSKGVVFVSFFFLIAAIAVVVYTFATGLSKTMPFPEEGEVNGVSYYVTHVTDRWGDPLDVIHFDNESDATVAVEFAPGSFTHRIPALGPSDHGIIIVEGGLHSYAEDPLSITTTKNVQSPAKARISWSEVANSGEAIEFKLINNSNSAYRCKLGRLITGILTEESYLESEWKISNNASMTSVESGSYSFNLKASDFEPSTVFGNEFDLYIDGVRIPRAQG